jgi:hypothetical protein
MKKMTAEDLLALEYGDSVFLRHDSHTTTYRYVGRMPSSKRYLIFSNGENLKHLYIGEDNSFRGEWFSGEYDDKFMLQIRIEELEKELEFLRKELEK